MNLGLVTCFFNPCGYKRIVENYFKFIEGLGEHAKRLTTVVLTLDDDENPISGDSVIEIRGRRPDNFMWQKEALLNHGMNQLPSEYDAVAWLDADILFESQTWLEDTEEILKQHTICQMFTRANYLTRRGQLDYSKPSLAYSAWRGKYNSKVAMGLAWAGRREAIGGYLIDWCVTGNADCFMAEAWLNNMSQRRSSSWMWHEYVKWAEAQTQHTKGEIGFIPGTVTHLFHGKLINRRYGFRTRLLKEKAFNPNKDIERDPESGVIWKWTNNNPYLREHVIKWFHARKEDE